MIDDDFSSPDRPNTHTRTTHADDASSEHTSPVGDLKAPTLEESKEELRSERCHREKALLDSSSSSDEHKSVDEDVACAVCGGLSSKADLLTCSSCESSGLVKKMILTIS